ncbi:MFS transporter [Dactylosporangium sp. CS-047395]|uniref:MFS transporter n=1 Tax=Dactylosporangium sp. CS-047395 TaxID=3239936 RepID=UPI003D91BA21
MHDRAVLLVCLGAGFTTLLDQSVLTIVVPALRESLGAGPAALQWIVAGYSLSFGLALVPAGRLGDMLGRRGLFVGGLALFAAGAVVAGTASAAWLVAAARLAQGIGAGTVNPQIIGLFQDLFTGRERARALAAYATVGGLAATLGPPVGGLVLELTGPDLGWRLVLLLNLPFALVMIPLARARPSRWPSPRAAWPPRRSRSGSCPSPGWSSPSASPSSLRARPAAWSTRPTRPSPSPTPHRARTA